MGDENPSNIAKTIECADKGKKDPEFELFEGSMGMPLKSGTFYPSKANLASSWIVVSYEAMLEGSLKVGLPEKDEEDGKRKDYAASFFNRLPWTQLITNFESAKWNGDWGLKSITAHAFDAEKVLTLGKIELGTGEVKVPDFEGFKNKNTAVEFTLSVEIASIDCKNDTATVFPIEGACEIPIVADLLPKGWIVKGDIKLVFALKAGVNGVKLAIEFGKEVAEEGGEEIGISLAECAGPFIIGAVISIAIVIFMEKLLYGASDDFKSIDSRTNLAADKFAAGFSAGLKNQAKPTVEDAYQSCSDDGFTAGQTTRTKTIATWKSAKAPPKEIADKMKGGMSIDDAIAQTPLPDDVVGQLAAKARVQYLPMARLKIITDFIAAHPKEHVLIASTIEWWYVNGQLMGANSETVTTAGWNSIPPSLQGTYRSYSPPGPNAPNSGFGERRSIQGIDPGH